MPAAGDSACVETSYELGNIRKISFAVTFDSGDGSFADHVVTTKFEGRLIHLVTNPGAVAPTDNYDVTLVDQNGHDVLEGVGVDRDTADTEKARVVYAASSVHPVVDECDVLTLKIANQAVVSATTLIELTYALGG